jgi:hypothetical protein
MATRIYETACSATSPGPRRPASGPGTGSATRSGRPEGPRKSTGARPGRSVRPAGRAGVKPGRTVCPEMWVAAGPGRTVRPMGPTVRLTTGAACPVGRTVRLAAHTVRPGLATVRPVGQAAHFPMLEPPNPIQLSHIGPAAIHGPRRLWRPGGVEGYATRRLFSILSVALARARWQLHADLEQFPVRLSRARVRPLE